MELHNLQKGEKIMSTINGKPLKQIIEELAADFPSEAIKQRDFDGVFYISVDDYRERLNQVVGIEHYNEKYTPVTIVQAKDSFATKTLGTIELLDDDYNIILTKESSGGSNISFPKIDAVNETGDKIKVPGMTTNSIPNDLDSACQDAFKRICKNKFDMGKKQLKQAAMGTKYVLKITQSMKPYNGHLFGSCICENDGYQYKLAVYKQQVNSFKEVCNGIPQNGDTVTVYGEIGSDKQANPQIIVKNTVPNSYQSKSGNSSATSSSADKKDEHEQRPADCTKPNVNLNIESIILRVNTVSHFKAMPKNNSSFCVQAQKNSGNEREQISIIFLPEQIAENNDKWKSFFDTVNKKSTKFQAQFCVKKGIYYFKKFVTDQAS